MRAVVLAIALALSACAEAVPSMEALPVPPVQVPAGLRSCPVARLVPPEPPVPRTVREVLDWSIRVAAVATANGDALTACRRRVFRLNDLLQETTR